MCGKFTTGTMCLFCEDTRWGVAHVDPASIEIDKVQTLQESSANVVCLEGVWRRSVFVLLRTSTVKSGITHDRHNTHRDEEITVSALSPQAG